MGKFFRYLMKSSGRWVVFCCFVSMCTVLFSAGLFGVAGFIISVSALMPAYDVIMMPVVFVRFFGLGRAGLSYLERMSAHSTTFRILKELRVYVYDRMIARLPDSSGRRGNMLSTVLTDVETLQNGFLRFFYPILTSALLLAAGIAVAAFFSADLAAVFAAVFTVLVYLLPLPLFALTDRRESRRKAEQRALYNEYLEMMGGMAEITVNGRQRQWLARIGGSVRGAGESALSLHETAAFSEGLVVLFQGCSLFAILTAACRLGAAGKLGGVMIAAATLTVSTIVSESSQVVNVYSVFRKIRDAANAVFALPEAKTDAGSGSVPNRVEPVLALESLGFSYPGSRELLGGLSLRLRAGEAAAVVGESGCGKSTLISLILGFLAPCAGRILLNGADLSTVSGEERLRLFSVCDQRPYFFNETIRENLRIADPDADDARLKDALEKAGLFGLVNASPQGLDSMVFEWGANFSGGELQRLAVARCILKEAPVYIFDEPTAGLDTLNEKKIMELILSLKRKSAVLVITHRRVMLDRFDRVIRLGESGADGM